MRRPGKRAYTGVSVHGCIGAGVRRLDWGAGEQMFPGRVVYRCTVSVRLRADAPIRARPDRHTGVSVYRCGCAPFGAPGGGGGGGRIGVSVYRCIGAGVRRSAPGGGVSVYRCMGVSVYRCGRAPFGPRRGGRTGVSVYRCIGAGVRRRGARGGGYRCIGVSVLACWGAGEQMHWGGWCTAAPYRCADMPIRRYAGTPDGARGRTGLSVYRCVSVYRCGAVYTTLSPSTLEHPCLVTMLRTISRFKISA